VLYRCLFLDMTVLGIHRPHEFTVSTLPFGMKCFVVNIEETGSAGHFCEHHRLPLCSVKGR
jgi:hypothetical protein